MLQGCKHFYCLVPKAEDLECVPDLIKMADSVTHTHTHIKRKKRKGQEDDHPGIPVNEQTK